MKAENQTRNTPDNTNAKILAVLDYFLSGDDSTKILEAINDPSIEVLDIIELIERLN